MKRTILSLIAICSTSLALQAQMPQSYTLKSCLEYDFKITTRCALPATRNKSAKTTLRWETPVICRHLTSLQVIKEP